MSDVLVEGALQREHADGDLSILMGHADLVTTGMIGSKGRESVALEAAEAAAAAWLDNLGCAYVTMSASIRDFGLVPL